MLHFIFLYIPCYLLYWHAHLTDINHVWPTLPRNINIRIILQPILTITASFRYLPSVRSVSFQLLDVSLIHKFGTLHHLPGRTGWSIRLVVAHTHNEQRAEPASRTILRKLSTTTLIQSSDVMQTLYLSLLSLLPSTDDKLITSLTARRHTHTVTLQCAAIVDRLIDWSPQIFIETGCHRRQRPVGLRITSEITSHSEKH